MLEVLLLLASMFALTGMVFFGPDLLIRGYMALALYHQFGPGSIY